MKQKENRLKQITMIYIIATLIVREEIRIIKRNYSVNREILQQEEKVLWI
jgi:hypothetical protein